MPLGPALTCWMEPSQVKHPESQCDCQASASPLALRWRSPDCGKRAIMKVATLACECDGESIKNVDADKGDQRKEPKPSSCRPYAKSATLGLTAAKEHNMPKPTTSATDAAPAA